MQSHTISMTPSGVLLNRAVINTNTSLNLPNTSTMHIANTAVTSRISQRLLAIASKLSFQQGALPEGVTTVISLLKKDQVFQSLQVPQLPKSAIKNLKCSNLVTRMVGMRQAHLADGTPSQPWLQLSQIVGVTACASNREVGGRGRGPRGNERDIPCRFSLIRRVQSLHSSQLWDKRVR